MRFASTALIAAVVCPACVALGQVRVANWNISQYDGGRDADIQTAVYGVYNGRSMSPDVIVVQEFEGLSSLQSFRTILNGAPGSPGDWDFAPFVENSATHSYDDNAMFYRTGKLQWLDTVTLDDGTSTSGAVRDDQRWHVRLVGYTGAGAELYLFGAHMKAGSTDTDQARRQDEALRIRSTTGKLYPTDALVPGGSNDLPPGSNFLFSSDTNMQSSTQTAYQTLTTPGADANGEFFDPINAPGDWNNNGAFRFVHTQDPASSYGMDDRHDQILVSAALRDGEGLDYMGSTTLPYSETTWNDPNHSYRAWGNDGTTFNQPLNPATNAMVGPAIAQAIINAAVGSGHLPVFLDLKVPAKIDAPATIDFGSVMVGDAAQAVITIANGADVARFSRDGTGSGIDDLTYTMSASGGFGAPSGTFAADAGQPGNAHVITMPTDAAGTLSGTLTITSDDPDQPVYLVSLTGVVGSRSTACACETDGDPAQVDVFDLLAYLDGWFAMAPEAEFTGDVPPSIDVFDLLSYLDCWFAASVGNCPPPPAPTGACCTGAACSIMTGADCDSAGGTYMGDGVACGGGSCQGPDGGLIISEVVDGTLAGGNPKFVEITNAGSDPYTFAAGGIIVQSNGSTDTNVDVDLTGVTIQPGASFVIAADANGGQTVFESTYGFSADVYSGAPFGNGNDRYILTDAADGSHLIDTYGQVGVDGAGSAWEYTNGYAYRNPGVHAGNGGAFDAAEWTIGGVDALYTGDDVTEAALIVQLTTPGTHQLN